MLRGSIRSGLVAMVEHARPRACLARLIAPSLGMSVCLRPAKVPANMEQTRLICGDFGNSASRRTQAHPTAAREVDVDCPRLPSAHEMLAPPSVGGADLFSWVAWWIQRALAVVCTVDGALPVWSTAVKMEALDPHGTNCEHIDSVPAVRRAATGWHRRSWRLCSLLCSWGVHVYVHVHVHVHVYVHVYVLCSLHCSLQQTQA